MRRQLTSGLLSLALIGGGALAGATIATQDAGGTDQSPERTRPAAHAPQDVIRDGGVARIFGGDRYETAVAISQYYGWETGLDAVYIASGQDYPDALSIGLSALDDGPLLLVREHNIPAATQAELARLQPCYIDIVGGSGVIDDTVFEDLKAYADPTPCETAP